MGRTADRRARRRHRTGGQCLWHRTFPLWLGQGLQRQPEGGNIFRALAMLPAFTGNIGKPGAGFYYLNDSFGIANRKGARPAYEAPSPDDDGPPSISQMDVPDLLQDRPDTFRAYMVWNCNPVASNPSQTKMRRGLSNATISSPSSSTVSRPIPPTTRISFCRRQAFWSSTTSRRPTSTSPMAPW